MPWTRGAADLLIGQPMRVTLNHLLRTRIQSFCSSLKRRAFAHFVGRTLNDGIAFLKRTNHLNEITISCTFLDVYPFCVAVFLADNKSSFCGCDNSSLRHPKAGVGTADGPVDRRRERGNGRTWQTRRP
jgi:hypothetical protein